MAKLIYTAIMSLDGYIEDQAGRFDWAAPDEPVHQFVNDLVRSVGTYLYGRRMYDTMAVWETEPGFAAGSAVTQDFAALWQAADKIVFSRTLAAASTTRTRIEREFEPDAIRRLKAAARQDLGIGGPELAAQAFQARLVDECHFFLAPIVVGGGKPAFPQPVRVELNLIAERRFAGGMMYLGYRVVDPGRPKP